MTAVSLYVETLDTSDGAIDRAMRLIDGREKARAAQFRFARDGTRFVARRARLREILAMHTGDAPERLSFSSSDHGKPFLVNGALHFSLSHSHGRMMLAVARVEVGCDIEWIDPDLDWRPIAERLFTPAEHRAMTAMPEAQARRAFFDCWSRKEAYVKALGLGLSYPLDAFEVSVEREARLYGAAGWAMIDAARDEACAASVAVRGDPATGISLDLRCPE